MKPGRFITFEGIEGAGKSCNISHAGMLLKNSAKPVMLTREPGGTPLGESLRELLLGHKHDDISSTAELLLMFAARREHLDKVIFPALSRGDWVISDRFTDASFAYQGGGRQVGITKLENLEQWAQGVLQPDLTLYFDVPVELGQQRIAGIKSADRFEKEQTEFFQRVRAAYLARVEKYPERMRLIDASQSLQKVQEAIRHIMEKVFPLK